MSRIGKRIINIPSGVNCRLEGNIFFVKGVKGELQVAVNNDLEVKIDDNKISVIPKSDKKLTQMLWGTIQSLINNSVIGVSIGFTKKLEMTGVGYRAQIKESNLVLQLGFSHDIKIAIPNDINIICEKPTMISVSGASKQKVGEFAANIRKYRVPEPYKGKGIKYENEYILRKEGKRK